MNLLRNRLTDLENELTVTRGMGEKVGGRDSQGVWDGHVHMYLKWVTNKALYTGQGILLGDRWQPGWEGSLGEHGYMYMYGWVPLLSTWNHQNIVNQLYSNIK